jgi:undecaprenyl-diphosphatase
MTDRGALTAAILWLTLLGLCIALSVLAGQHDTLPGDSGIISWAQDLAFPGEALSDGVRAITSTQVVLAMGAVLSLLLWLRGYRLEALIFAAGLVILPLLQSGIKELVDRPRPAADLVEIRGSFSSPSFPSGHVMGATYLYGLLLYLALRLRLTPAARAGVAAVCCGVLLLSGPANVWLGVHWPSDVLGGYAWGLALVLPAAAVRERLSGAT